MAGQGAHGYWIVLATFFCAAVLAILPLPNWLLWGRPEWMALALIYWCIALPHRVGVFSALILGVLLDVLEGAVFGQNLGGACYIISQAPNPPV